MAKMPEVFARVHVVNVLLESALQIADHVEHSMQHVIATQVKYELLMHFHVMEVSC